MVELVDSKVAKLISWLQQGKVAALIGAGLSTDSGIPDYRGPLTRQQVRRPMRHDEFISSAEARQRYWARASRGWATIARAKPNSNHTALAHLEQSGILTGSITQNVDGLQQAAGCSNVLELHGSLHRVNCLGCARQYPREEVQDLVQRLNGSWFQEATAIAPDGDAEIDPAVLAEFKEPLCPHCRSTLMPDVVFFGGSVPAQRVQEARQLVEESDALLVVGSSLTVYSGYRFVRWAAAAGRPVAILTLGPTRGDHLAHLRLDLPLKDVLPLAVQQLTSTPLTK